MVLSRAEEVRMVLAMESRGVAEVDSETKSMRITGIAKITTRADKGETITTIGGKKTVTIAEIDETRLIELEMTNSRAVLA